MIYCKCRYEICISRTKKNSKPKARERAFRLVRQKVQHCIDDCSQSRRCLYQHGKTTRKQIQLEKATKKAYRDHEIIVPLKLQVSESQISKEFSFLQEGAQTSSEKLKSKAKCHRQLCFGRKRKRSKLKDKFTVKIKQAVKAKQVSWMKKIQDFAFALIQHGYILVHPLQIIDEINSIET